MLTIQQPETQNATGLSGSNIEGELWLLESQKTVDSIHEDTSNTSKQVPDTSKHEFHSLFRSSSKDSPNLSHKISNFAENALAGYVSDISEHTSETSSQSVCKDASILSLESDVDISRISEDLSTRIIPTKETDDITKITLEAPSRPVCRNGSSSSLDTESETSSMSMSISINPSEEIADISKNNLPVSSAPTIKDGSCLSLYSDEESVSASETALATIRYAGEIGSISSESEGEDNVLSQLPRNLIAQTPQVLVDNSSDVHIGPHFQYSGPITVKQYITVNGKEAIESDNLSNSKVPTEMPHLKEIVDVTLKSHGKATNKNDSAFSEVLTDVKNVNNFVVNENYSAKLPNNLSYLNSGAKDNRIHMSEDVLLNGSEVTLLRVKKFLKMRYILICLVVIIICTAVSLSLVLPGKEYSSENLPVKPKHINMTCKFKNLRVSEGEKTIQWVVDITSTIGKLKVDWYGPGCKLIEHKDGLSKYEIDMIYQENGKMQTVLKVLNVTQSDRGMYRLHVYNDKEEQWDYYTLTVLVFNTQRCSYDNFTMQAYSYAGIEVIHATDTQDQNLYACAYTPFLAFGYCNGEQLVEHYKCDGHIVACYVAEWAHLRIGEGLFTVENIEPSLCTHLLYAFANLDTTTNTIYPADPGYDLGNKHEKGAYEKMTSLKKKYPHLKVLISMGGWAEREQKNYSIVAESPERRKEFVASVVDFIRKYNFDGLDLHWQYPTEKNGVPADKQNFVYLVKELREEFDRQGEQWLLTAPLGMIPNTIQGSYDIPEITKYLHYMFALCYGYHGFWDKQTGPNAPLYRSKAGDEFNAQASIQKLLKYGAQPEKLVLGLPLNGRTFILENEKDSEGFGGPSVESGFTGPFVQETGTLGYNEICLELGQKHSNWVKHWDNVSRTPFVTYKKKFMSYDNEKSLTEKVEFALNKKLAGVVAYSLDTDDFRGACAFDNTGVTNYPLMRAINQAFYTASFGPMEQCKSAYKPK